ncbi:ribokinase [Noviherbaspirillum aridicola]|uniref:Ribokinase n=1 Tax=Noviherbaspirillum aridicola TaxID=2849687 RepID=A0ABQ4Q027_9BURK|nr:ribokinase [Noviherbaspirillum aridicola]GIZ50134.1 ribokinase [Noviherbaspirillum aridicola]
MTRNNSPSAPAVLALGSINADFQVRIARRPEVSETLIASDFTRLSGGKSANVAWLAARLGVPVRLYGHVGDDDLAEQALAPLRRAGIPLDGVRRVAGQATGVSMITVPPDGKKGIVLAPNANHAWDEAACAALAGAIRGCPPESVLATNGEIPAAALRAAMRAARETGIACLLDPSPADAIGDDLIALADFLAPNAGEAQQLCGFSFDDAQGALRAARALRERGAGVVCVKLADGGCVAWDGGRALHVPPAPVEVVDSTGAGDAFAGALAVALLERRPLEEAVRFAVAASHLAVTGWGSQPAYPGREAIGDMMRRLEARGDAQ